MGEFVAGLMILIAVTGIAMLAFGVWVTFLTVGGVMRLIGRVLAPPGHPLRRPDAMPGMQTWVQCDYPPCRADNPAAARFCRRCGSPIRHPGDVRHAAMI